MSVVARRRPFRPLPLLIAVLAGALAALPWVFSPGPPPPAAMATPSVAAPVVVPPLAALAETVERPLFENLRQVVRRQAVAAPRPVGPVVIGRYRLLGVISSGGVRQVVLAQLDSGKSVLRAAGQELDGWRIAEISDDGLTVRRNGETETVRLVGPTSPKR
jgi:hypothetical protein